ncbi:MULTISPECIES: bifunctional riboflavin kinase/FAD synthetase [unclassified Romboutsia]|uniref:bifunctional riboflavin kinase/FAD synthetase n=1 Tax=unclassified Romboutsia TaxID=2626894 RepID=UPI000821ECEB|nr:MULTISPECIES: bifunctional riboflavin kinase/FAD synthetase [unclassified Romboutsia]SCH06815.1 Riboflavin biosynthesis protein ribF [uncultured Clostridium sp.]
MDIVKSIWDVENLGESVVTIGKFDGLHNGHKVLIKKAVQCSKKRRIKSVVFTFENHPANYFRNHSVKNIIRDKDKMEKLSYLGIDIVVNVPFDEEMTKISADDFAKKILKEKLGAKKVIVGHDFTFARNKEGNAKLLKLLGAKYDFKVEVVNPVKINNIRVSSTYIRNLIAEGSVNKVKEYLGRNYQLEGEVIKSKQLGRTIGFPTANMKIEGEMLIPKCGIYATKVYLDEKTYFGATNIGYNPTVNGDNLSVETNILDFNEDIYGKFIKIEFLERIRDEKKFNSLEELKSQLKIDTNYIYEKYICKK